jgi:hypothetical protein
MSPKVLWDVVRVAATHAGIEKLAPHDLRRTCARLCHLAGGELEQIQFLLGHVSVQTTERYLGCKQKLRCAVNDRLGIEPDAAARPRSGQGRTIDPSALRDYSKLILAAAEGFSVGASGPNRSTASRSCRRRAGEQT